MTLLVIGTLSLVGLLGGCQAGSNSSNAFHPPIVITEGGPLIGSSSHGVDEFLGIPYAAAPMGALRWIPPQAYGKWQGLLEATQFGSECTQPGPSGSENCLFLNIYAPEAQELLNGQSGLPVMVWIHGGGLVSGAGALYDPTRLVAKGVIVVTINYRLGYLGFFAQSAIDAEGHLNGNYGLMDQQFALKWVRRNIAAFGGDPERVTIFGQSAGGQSAYAHLVSPVATGLFDAAIVESGAYREFQPYFDYIVTLAIAESTGTALVPSGSSIAARVGCASQTSSCLRGVPAATLVAVEPGTLFPFVDGTLLTQTPSTAFASGQFNRVPVISGSNHDEWRLFVADQYDRAGNPILNLTEYETAVTELWGPGLEPLVLFLYPFASYPSGGVALGASGTDGIFSCPARNADLSLSKFVTTYAYEFNDENAPPPQSSIPWLTFPLGAYHTAELQYLFTGDFFGLPMAPLSDSQQLLSRAMINYWTQFAKTGDPNSPGEPLWSPYRAQTDEFQSLVPPIPLVEFNFDTAHQCSTFWNTLP